MAGNEVAQLHGQAWAQHIDETFVTQICMDLPMECLRLLALWRFQGARRPLPWRAGGGR